MAIKVLVADDSDLLRSAIVRLLARDADLQVVGEASCFAETLEKTAALKPDVLLLDLHMPDEREYPPAVVKAQLQSVDCVVGMSLWNDADANALAESFGARGLLDKAALASALIPTIKRFCNIGMERRAEANAPEAQPVASPSPKDETDQTNSA